MFQDLIDALRSVGLKPGESISLSKLCKQTGLKSYVWAERLNSAGIFMMILEDLETAGFIVRVRYHGRRRGYHFELAESD